MTFKQWVSFYEGSPSTRRRHDAALGLAPPVADYNSRSTPAPWEKEENEKAFKSTHKRGKKKKGLTDHEPEGLISVGPDGKVNKKKRKKKDD